MIVIYDRNMKKLAYLQNAYSIGYETPLNEIWSASFFMPMDDQKNEYCQPFNYIEVWEGQERIELFRIMPTRTFKSIEARSIKYECEHVIATLYDDGIDDYFQMSNYPTRDVLEALLRYQDNRLWRLGRCEITRRFHYSAEKENLLPIIYSVPKPFDEMYQWTFNTTSIPWTLNLDRVTDELVGEARWGHNVLGIEKVVETEQMANRIYAYGYGEGVNQLDITSVNPTGRKYVEDRESIAKYGLISMWWVDRRFEHADVLYGSARAKLRQMAWPKVTYDVNVVDLKQLGDLNRFDVGKIVRIIDEDMGTVEVRVYNFKKSDLGKPQDVQLEIGNRLEDTGATEADLKRRQQTNETYSQGATNIDSHSYADNADPQHPAKIRFYLDEGLVNINTMTLSYELEPFRAYSRAIEGGGAIVSSTKAGGAIIKATESGGATVQSTSAGGAMVDSTSSGGSVVKSSGSGGGSQQTSSNGGGTSRSTSSGGGTVNSSGAGGDHHHIMFQTTGDRPIDSNTFVNATTGNGTIVLGPSTPTMTHFRTHTSSGNHTHSVNVPSHAHDFTVPNHTHTVNIPAHTHQIDIPNHTHQINIPNHRHEVTIPSHTHEVRLPDHTHEIELPDHTHEIQHGIYELNRRPRSVQIRVDGNLVPHTSTNGNEINIIPYLAVDGGGKVRRGTWHEVTITPDDLGRVTADIISRLFIQSRSGGVF